MQVKKLNIANTPESPLCPLLITMLVLLIIDHRYPSFMVDHLFSLNFYYVTMHL